MAKLNKIFQRRVGEAPSVIAKLKGTVTLWIIIGCVVIYIGMALLNLFGVWSRQASYSWLGLSWVGLSKGMLWQLITSPLVHFSIPHLVFNMLVLAYFGVDVEKRLGLLGYVFFSVICALAGSAGFLLLGDSLTIGAGYSGVIYGVMVACAVFWPDRVICAFHFFPMKMKWAMLLMAGMALFLTIEPGRDSIAHAAHLGGAAAGFVFVKLWKQRESLKQDSVETGEQMGRQIPNDHKKIPAIRVPDEL